MDRSAQKRNETAFLRGALVPDGDIGALEILGDASRSIRRRFPDFAGAAPMHLADRAVKCATASPAGLFS